MFDIGVTLWMFDLGGFLLAEISKQLTMKFDLDDWMKIWRLEKLFWRLEPEVSSTFFSKLFNSKKLKLKNLLVKIIFKTIKTSLETIPRNF